MANINIETILLKRGNTAHSSTYTGPLGELVIDTDLHNIRVQDGNIAGGHLLTTASDFGNLSSNVANLTAVVTSMELYGNANVADYLAQFPVTAIIPDVITTSNIYGITGNGYSGDVGMYNHANTGGIKVETTGAITVHTPGGLLHLNQYGELVLADVANPIVYANGQSILAGISGGGGGTGSTLVNGSYTVSLGSNGTLSLAGNVDYKVPGLGGSGQLGINSWYPVHLTVNDGADLPFQTWTFGTNGEITTPQGGVIGDTYGDGRGTSIGAGAGSSDYAGINSHTGDQWIEADNYAAYIGTNFLTGGGNVWTFDKLGGITFPDSTRQTTAWSGQSANVGNVAPTTGTGSLWYDTTDGRMYANIGTVWVDANPTVAPAPSFYLGNITIDDGNVITFPGGTLTVDSTGNLLVNGSRVSGSGGGSNYTDANVISLLSAFGSHGITTTGTVAVGAMNISGGITWTPGNGSTIYEDSGLIVQGAVSVAITSPGSTEVTAGSYNYYFDNAGILTLPNSISFSSTTVGAPGTAGGNRINLYPGQYQYAIGIDSSTTWMSSANSIKLYAGSDTWTFNTTGQLITPGSLIVNSADGTQAIVFSPDSGSTINGALNVDSGANMLATVGSGFIVKVAGNDRLNVYLNDTTVSAGNNLYLKSNKNTSDLTWEFGQNGNITLPTNSASINYANGMSILNGISGGTVNTGDITFMGNDIIGLGTNVTITADTTNWGFYSNANLVLPSLSTISEGASPSGVGQAMLFTPAGGTDPNQLLKVYPTIVEGNHLHLTSGNLSQTSLFLGDDAQYVRTNNGNIVIGTGDSIPDQPGYGHRWQFDNTGALTFPDNSTQTTAYTGYGNSNVTAYLSSSTVNVGNLTITGGAPVALTGSAGDTAGMIRVDSDYLYHCTATYADQHYSATSQTQYVNGIWYIDKGSYPEPQIGWTITGDTYPHAPDGMGGYNSTTTITGVVDNGSTWGIESAYIGNNGVITGQAVTFYNPVYPTIWESIPFSSFKTPLGSFANLVVTGSAPSSSVGALGDVAGAIRVDNNYLYYCTSTFVPNYYTVGWEGASGNTIFIAKGSYPTPQVGWIVSNNSGYGPWTIATVTDSGSNWQLTFVGTGYGQAGGGTATLTNPSQPTIWETVPLGTFKTPFNTSVSNYLTTYLPSYSGNLTAGNLTISGNINYVGNAIVQNIQTGNFTGNIAGFGAIYAGIVSGYSYQPQTVIQASTNFNDYAQINHQNINSGTRASTDFVATADIGNSNAGFIDMGINSSGFVGGTGNELNYPLDGYLLVTGTASNNGNLLITTDTAADVVISTNGQGLVNQQARFKSNVGLILYRTTPSTSTTTGALQVAGGAGIQGNLFVGNVLATGFFYANGTAFVGGGGTTYSNANVVSMLSANSIVALGNVNTYPTQANITQLFVGNNTTIGTGTGTNLSATQILNNAYFGSNGAMYIRNTYSNGAGQFYIDGGSFYWNGQGSGTANAVAGMGTRMALTSTALTTYNSVGITSAGAVTGVGLTSTNGLALNTSASITTNQTSASIFTNATTITVGSAAGSAVFNGNLYSYGNIGNNTGNISVRAQGTWNLLSTYSGAGGYNSPPYLNQSLTGGSGTGMTANYGATGGYPNSYVIVNPGTGYKNGDVLTLPGGAGSTVILSNYNPNYSGQGVANWLFSMDGNIAIPAYANIVSNGTTILSTLNGTSSITVTGNATAAYFVGNGSALTGITANGYANIYGTTSNVTLVAGNYSYTFDTTGNLVIPGGGDIVMANASSTIAMTGNIYAGNIVGTQYGNSIGTSATYTGNVTAGNVIVTGTSGPKTRFLWDTWQANSNVALSSFTPIGTIGGNANWDTAQAYGLKLTTTTTTQSGYINWNSSTINYNYDMVITASIAASGGTGADGQWIYFGSNAAITGNPGNTNTYGGIAVMNHYYSSASQFEVYVNSTQTNIPYIGNGNYVTCLLYTSPSPRDRTRSRMPSSA